MGGRHRHVGFFGTSTFYVYRYAAIDLDSEIRVTGTWYRDTGLQGYRVTVIQGYRGTGTGLQGCRDTGTGGTRDLRQGDLIATIVVAWPTAGRIAVCSVALGWVYGPRLGGGPFLAAKTWQSI